VKKLFLLLTLAVLPVLAACGSFGSYAAKVNGERITRNELDRELNAILGNKAYLEQVNQGFAQETGGETALGPGQDTFSTVFVARVLERRIAFEIVRQEFERRNLELTDKDLEEARKELIESIEDENVFNSFPKGYRDELVRFSAQSAVLERALSGGEQDDAAVRSFYEANRARFQTNCVRHILVPDQAQAVAIKGRISRGEDFAALARAESKDNQGPGGGSAARGGDLGCVAKGSLVPPVEAALERLQPGQVSDPVQTQFGFHVIQLVERKDRPFEEVAPAIRQQLQQQQSPDALRNFMAESLAKAEITVNPRYGKFVRNGNDIGILAPSELTTTTTTAPAARP
jgi:foldase protein PrsA